MTTSYGQMDTLKSVLKPRIGIGTGVLTYFGEVQNYQIGFLPTVNRVAGSIYVNAPISKAFNIEFSTMYGKIGANERSLTRNLNFESRIRSGSLMLSYNFYPLFKNIRHGFTPYVGIGFSSFEFLSKTDLYDKNGNKYYYWSDGNIMDLPESDPLAANANRLYRDYTYETDLREQNFDSLGKYKEQSFAIPISFGGEWHLTPRIDFRASTTINYSFTDLIDNISPAGTGDRQGDNKNDYFMYTSASISYDLEFNRNVDSEDYTDFDGTLGENEFDQTDTDQDGVIDAYDYCPKTPLEAIVDDRGCPLDTDKDGIADYFDEEENTPIGNWVDEYGVTISEDEFTRRRLKFIDSTGAYVDFDKDYLNVDLRDKEGRVLTSGKKLVQPPRKSYVVIIGKEHKDVSATELHKYLGYNEFQTITKGDTVFYVLGEYENIEDAVAAQTSLEDKGIEVQVIGKTKHDNSDFTEVSEAVVEKVEKVNLANGKEVPTFAKPDQVFRVQVGAFKTKIDPNKLYPNISSLVYATGEDGITRYYTGNFDNYDDADAYKKTLVKNGYDKSFVVAYEDHERVTLKEAGVKLPAGYDENSELSTFAEARNNNNATPEGTVNSNIDMSQVQYRIILGHFESDIPVETIDVFMSIGGIRPVKNSDGSTSYYSKSAKSETEANHLIADYSTYGLKDIEVVYEYKGKFYTKPEFLKLTD